MQKLVLGVVTAVLATGCATGPKGPAHQIGASALSGKTIVQTVRPAPGFSVMKTGHVMFGLLGAAMGARTGNEIIQSNNVADPAQAIGVSVMKDLAAKHGMTVLAPAMPVDSNDAARISATARGQVNYVLDVQTYNWSIGYFPTDWTHYRVLHFAHARLIDTATGKVVAQSKCQNVPTSNVNAPTYEQLVGANAEGLKRALHDIGSNCAATLKSSMFAL